MFLIIPIVILTHYYWSRRHLYAAAAKLKGPSGLPLIGNAHIFIGKSEGTYVVYIDMPNYKKYLFMF